MFIRGFFSHANAKGARSTALHSLQWALGLLLATLPALVSFNAPNWILSLVFIFISLVVAVFLGAYVYLLIKNPDALRSEEFSLSKLAMEKGLVGDNVHGLSDPRITSVPVIQSTQIGSNQGVNK